LFRPVTVGQGARRRPKFVAPSSCHGRSWSNPLARYDSTLRAKGLFQAGPVQQNRLAGRLLFVLQTRHMRHFLRGKHPHCRGRISELLFNRIPGRNRHYHIEVPRHRYPLEEPRPIPNWAGFFVSGAIFRPADAVSFVSRFG
jgi:hypothetical protein